MSSPRKPEPRRGALSPSGLPASPTPAFVSLAELAAQSGRSCGECAACCFSLGVPSLQKPEDRWCPHAARGRRGACTIYEQRPTECRVFHCGWLAGLMDEGGDRPDHLGAVLDPRTEHVNVHLRPERSRMAGRLERYIREVVERGAVVIIRRGAERFEVVKRALRLSVARLEDPAAPTARGLVERFFREQDR